MATTDVKTTVVKDESGREIGTITSYPDTAEDRAELILMEGAKAIDALVVPHPPRRRRRTLRR